MTNREDEKITGAYSNLKIFYHTDKVKDILENRRTAPIYIRIKPTNICNQNCYYCGSKDENVPEERKLMKKAFIPKDKMEEIIKDIIEMGVKAVTFSGGGEPLCYPYIVPSINKLREGKVDYSIITNGQALEKEAAEALKDAKWVRISLESSNSKMYQAIRGVDTFDKVIGNIENFVRIKNKSCILGINCVVTNDNYLEIYNICKIASEIGINNIKFSPMRLDGDLGEYHSELKNLVTKQIHKAQNEFQTDSFKIIDKYTDDMGFEKDFVKEYHRCLIQEVFTVIGADCKLYLCHQRAYTKDGDIGDLSNSSFKDVWYSKETIEKVRNLDVCKACNFRCVFEERNILLNNLMNIDINHINFI